VHRETFANDRGERFADFRCGEQAGTNYGGIVARCLPFVRKRCPMQASSHGKGKAGKFQLQLPTQTAHVYVENMGHVGYDVVAAAVAHPTSHFRVTSAEVGIHCTDKLRDAQ